MTKSGPLTLNRNPLNGLLTGTSLGQISDQVTSNQFAEVIAYEATAGGTSLYSQTLERDAIGRITERTESISGVERTYAYCENNPVNYVDPEGLRLRVNPNLSPCDQEKLNGYLGFLRSLESGRTLLEKLELNPNDITITIGDVKRELGYSNPGTLLSF